MRATGADQFDDFELTILVHEATYTAQKLKINTKVRITAGDHKVETDTNNRGVYQEAVQLFVEQGSPEVKIELIDADRNKSVAVKKLDIAQDILNPKVQNKERSYFMKQVSKTLLNPKVKLTMLMEKDGEMEQGLLEGLNISHEANLMLRQQIQKEKEEWSGDEGSPGHHSGSESDQAHTLTDVELLVKVCKGPLEIFGSWGRRSSVYVAVRGPPLKKKYALGIWKSEADYHKDVAPDLEVELLKILGVMPDPAPKRAEVFVVQYVKDSAKDRITFKRVDRARDVWVEMLLVLIKQIREQKEDKKRHKHH
jgi:hypothetical protein